MKKKSFKRVSNSKLSKIKLIISDFDGVFTDNNVLICENGIEYVRCSRFDGIGISKLKNHNIKLIVISSEINDVVLKRCEKLNIEGYNNVKNKGDFIQKNIINDKLKKENILYIGNDENDISALDFCGISIGVKDSHDCYLSYVEYIINKNGGDGAIRYICDIIDDKLKNKY